MMEVGVVSGDSVAVKVVAMVAQTVENTNKKPCGHMLPCPFLELKTAAC